VLDLPAEAVEAALARIARPELDGFWIHVDVDVLDPALMPAVDSPEPGGLSLEGLARLLAPLVRHPKALGMEVTIYDPELDPDRTAGSRLVDLLGEVFRG
ncbi:MAG: arginase family protein, partial [Thermoanaerobaculia bacterium]